MKTTRLIAQSFLMLVAATALLCAITMQPVFDAQPGSRPGPAVEPATLEAHVRMLSVTLAPRDHESVRNLNSVAAYIGRQFTAAGGRAGEQVFHVDQLAYRNVTVQFGPESGERIVVGAHYDAADRLPGADDNASGVAGLIELARILGRSPPSIRVELVAYTLEEPPHYGTANMGSAIHAAALKQAGEAVRAMISLEMIGFFRDAEGSQGYPVTGLSLLYPSQGNFISIVGDYGSVGTVRTMKAAMIRAASLPVKSMNGPAFVPGVGALSDHMNYRLEGYRAVMVTDTAFFRNPNYHLASDTADTLDYKRMAQVVQGVYAAVIALGG